MARGVGRRPARPHNNYPTLPAQYVDHVTSVCTSISLSIGTLHCSCASDQRQRARTAGWQGSREPMDVDVHDVPNQLEYPTLTLMVRHPTVPQKVLPLRVLSQQMLYLVPPALL